MREQDFTDFSQMLDAVCSLLSRGAYIPSPTNTALFFRALAKHDIAAVRAGFDAHVADPQRGRFVPVPADILAQIEERAADDGRPGAEEAWALAVRGTDEADTVVWTAEVAEAWGIAAPVYRSGDEVGARMAFKAAYARLVDEARRARVAPQWSASLGTDEQRRAVALQHAGERGLLPAPERLALPAPEESFARLSAMAPPAVREKLQLLRERLSRRDEAPSEAELARADTLARKADAEAKVRAYHDQQRAA